MHHGIIISCMGSSRLPRGGRRKDPESFRRQHLAAARAQTAKDARIQGAVLLGRSNICPEPAAGREREWRKRF